MFRLYGLERLGGLGCGIFVATKMKERESHIVAAP
jgi:hypothetical protein